LDPLKENLRAALNFSRSEKRGILVLIGIMILIYLIPSVINIHNQKEEEIVIIASFIEFEKQLTANIEFEKAKEEKAAVYFNFNPNNVGKEELLQLGFPNYLIDRIIKYRKAGGRFFHKKDLMKIYGMKKSKYNELEPYIVIDDVTHKKDEKRKEFIKKVIIEINTADSADFKSLKGIGSVYAKRILSYRQSLGGFVKTEQLKEVYGISDSLYLSLSNQIILDSNYTLTRLKINDVNLNELRKHPYFRNYNLSKVIINYREMNGAYGGADDMRKIHLMTDSIIKKILPYIDFE